MKEKICTNRRMAWRKYVTPLTAATIPSFLAAFMSSGQPFTVLVREDYRTLVRYLIEEKEDILVQDGWTRLPSGGVVHCESEMISSSHYWLPALRSTGLSNRW